MESHAAELEPQLQTKECAVCGEQYAEEGEGDRCPLCKEYESIFDAAMNEVVDRTANRWRSKPSQLNVPCRTITREEWEAMGRTWSYPSLEDEFVRIMSHCNLSEVRDCYDFRRLVVRICDEKHGLIPFYAFKVVTGVLRNDPKIHWKWVTTKFQLRRRRVKAKFCYWRRKFSWTNLEVHYWYDGLVEDSIYYKILERKYEMQFDPWRQLVKTHRNFAAWLASFALKEDYVRVRKTHRFNGEVCGESVTKELNYAKVLQRLLAIEISEGFENFFKGEHPYAVMIRERRREEAERKRIEREERIAEHEANITEKREKQRKQQAAYRDRIRALKAAKKRAEEYAAEKALKAIGVVVVDPMEEWPEVDE